VKIQSLPPQLLKTARLSIPEKPLPRPDMLNKSAREWSSDYDNHIPGMLAWWER